MSSDYKKIQIRRGADSDFTSANPLLASGEPAYAIDTSILKIGDGETYWNDLPSISSLQVIELSGVLSNSINDQISALIDGAPQTLNTLNEIAAAIGDNANFVLRVNNIELIAEYSSGVADLAVISDISNITGNVSGINNIVFVDKDTYDNIAVKDPNTLYHIPEESSETASVAEYASGVAEYASGIAEYASGAIPSLIESDITPVINDVGSSALATGVNNIVIVSQSTYNAITNKDPNTIYFIPPWQPTELGTSVKLWLDATDSNTITLNGNNVSQWDDKSSNSFSLSQSNSSNQPQWIDQNSDYQINGKQAVKWTAETEYLQDLTLNIGTDVADHTTPIQVFVVFKLDLPSAWTTYHIWDGGITANERWFARFTSTNFVSATRNIDEGDSVSQEVNNVTGLTIGSNPSLISVSNNRHGNTSYIHLDGTDISPSNCEFGEEGLNGLILGNWIIGYDLSFGGRIGEFLICEGSQDEQTRQKIEGYLAHKWGLTTNLPSNHPYKTIAP